MSFSKISSKHFVISDEDSEEDSDYVPERKRARFEASHGKKEKSIVSDYFFTMDPKENEIVGREADALKILSMVQVKNGYLRPLLIGPSGIGKHSIIDKVSLLLKTKFNHPYWQYHTIKCLSIGKMDGSKDDILAEIQDLYAECFEGENKSILFIKDLDHLFSAKADDSGEMKEVMSSLFDNNFPFIGSISGEYNDNAIKSITEGLRRYHFEPVFVENPSLEEVAQIAEIYVKTHPVFPNFYIDAEAINFLVKVIAKHEIYKALTTIVIQKVLECANYTLIEKIQERKVIESIRLNTENVAKFMGHKLKMSGQELLNASAYSPERFIEKMKEDIIGQDQAIKIVSEAISSFKYNLADPTRPPGVFLFLGPSGVGKTELAKKLGKFVFGNEILVRIDCSEFSEQHYVARLIGAPPGYEGHESGGQLTNALLQNPYAIVLVDEFEKAHESVRKIFLQAFDEGRLTDGKGNTVDCTHVFFVVTTNIGSELMFKDDLENIQETLTQMLIQKFTPELYNRFTAVVPFNKLKEDDIKGVIEVQLRKCKERFLKQAGIEFEYDKLLIDYFAKHDFDYRLGMRNLCRTIDTKTKNMLTNFLSNRSFKGKIKMTVREDNIVLQIRNSLH